MEKTKTTISKTGRRLGRPQERYLDLIILPTRCQLPMKNYLKSRVPLRWKSGVEMHEELYTQFLKLQPWRTREWHWRRPKINKTYANGSTIIEWVLIHIRLEPDLAAEVKLTAKGCGVSTATFLYSGLWWFIDWYLPWSSGQIPTSEI